MIPDDLAALHAETFSSPRPWTAAEFTEVLSRPGAILITEDGGFAVGQVTADEVELLTLAVSASRRRQGIGHRLMQGFFTAAKGMGAMSAFLEVAEDNASALALYRAHGWQQAGRRKGYYTRAGTSSVDALILTRSLDGA